MTLSSDTLRKIEFRDGWRGYNQVDVDVFLEEVAAGIDALHAELAEARSRADRAESRFSGTGAAPETDETVRRTLTLAQRAADLVVGESKAVAERILADANLQASRISAAAESAAAAAKEAADTQAIQASEAHRRASQEEHDRLVAALGAQRSILDGEIASRRRELDEVQALAAATSDRLRAALTDHLARLDQLGQPRSGEVVSIDLEQHGAVAENAGVGA